MFYYDHPITLLGVKWMLVCIERERIEAVKTIQQFTSLLPDYSFIWMVDCRKT